jgi:transcription antitermination factor NusA-like protein
VGRGGERARTLRTALGGEPIAFIDAAAPMREQVAMALFPARVRSDEVLVPPRGSEPIVVTLAGREAARAIGRGGVNVALAQEAVGRALRISERGK